MKRCAILFLLAALVARAAETLPDISLLEDRVLRVHAGRLTEPFAEQFSAAQPTNPVTGIILDLRFSDGDKPAADLLAQIFATNSRPLMILVNAQTRGGAATLAAQLRERHAGVIIGSTNSPAPLQPDIVVAATAAEEKQFQDNPYAALATNAAISLSVSNEFLPYVDHMSEAELVRKKIKDVEDTPETTPQTRAAPPLVIRDPALARAMDLLKALAALHKSRG